MGELYKCCFCRKRYLSKDALYDHMEKEHSDELGGLPAMQVYFNFHNRYDLHKEFGKSVISGKPTKFNLITGRYERFADESERAQYRELFKKNMERVYGKDTILDEPDQQKKMLSGRSISGSYRWSDNKHVFTYTGSFERKFLEFLDLYLGWDNADDIMMPAPQIFPWKDSDGKDHFHIPDCYIQSSNLIINIKSSENKHYRLRDIEDENNEDAAIKKSGKFNYLKLYDNNFEAFVSVLKDIEDDPDKIISVDSMSYKPRKPEQDSDTISIKIGH